MKEHIQVTYTMMKDVMTGITKHTISIILTVTYAKGRGHRTAAYIFANYLNLTNTTDRY